MRYEFHSHTFLTDGELQPIEQVRRAMHAGHAAIALTDHVGATDLDRVVPTLVRECAAASQDWKIQALPGVEITHVAPRRIPQIARRARKMGARIVVVHGETVSEPVIAKTNETAARCEDVDVLAHPGFITERDARAAADHGVFLEITAKRAHAVTNGHLAQLLIRHDLPFLVNGDVHAPDQFVTEAWARTVARGAGLPPKLIAKGLGDHPRALLKRRA